MKGQSVPFPKNLIHQVMEWACRNDWAREDLAARAEGVEMREELIHNQRSDRVIEETVSATLREW